MAATDRSQRPDGIDIPERPTGPSGRPATAGPGRLDAVSGWSKRRRVLVAGGVAATGLAIALVALLLASGDERGAGDPGEAPLIKAEDQPIKVSPESPGGMQVPNRDMMVYGRLQGTPGGKPPVERLLPEPEQPLTPPSSKPPAPETPVSVTPMGEAPPPLMPEARPADEGSSGGAPPPPKSIASVPESAPTPTPAPGPASAPVAKPAPDKAAQQKAAAERAAAQKAAAEKAAAEKAAGEKVAKLDPGVKGAGGAYQVQLFAGRSADEAKGAWARLKGKNADLLGALSPTVARADLGDRGMFYRLRAGPLSSEAQAKTLCQSLSGRGTSCIIIRPGN